MNYINDAVLTFILYYFNYKHQFDNGDFNSGLYKVEINFHFKNLKMRF